MVLRASDSQSREPCFEYSCCRFETLAVSFTQHGTVDSVVNEYLATDSGGCVIIIIISEFI